MFLLQPVVRADAKRGVDFSIFLVTLRGSSVNGDSSKATLTVAHRVSFNS